MHELHGFIFVSLRVPVALVDRGRLSFCGSRHIEEVLSYKLRKCFCSISKDMGAGEHERGCTYSSEHRRGRTQLQLASRCLSSTKSWSRPLMTATEHTVSTIGRHFSAQRHATSSLVIFSSDHGLKKCTLASHRLLALSERLSLAHFRQL